MSPKAAPRSRLESILEWGASRLRPRCSRPTEPIPRKSGASPADCGARSTRPTAPTIPRPTRTCRRSRPGVRGAGGGRADRPTRLPRPEPAGAAGGPPGGRGSRRAERPPADRRRRVRGRSSGEGPADLRHRLDGDRGARFRDEGKYLSGRALTARPSLHRRGRESLRAAARLTRPAGSPKKSRRARSRFRRSRALYLPCMGGEFT